MKNSQEKSSVIEISGENIVIVKVSKHYKTFKLPIFEEDLCKKE